MIHNFAAFSEMYEMFNDDIYILSREGVKYGLIFVLTVSDTSTIRFKLKQNFKQEFVLQLNDQADYTDVVGNTFGLFPTATPGRGLIKLDGLYEFQTCKICSDVDELDTIKKLSGEMSSKYSNRAKSIPILPEIVDVNFVSRLISNLKALPIGVNKNTLEIVTMNMKDRIMTPVLATSLDVCESFADELIKVLSKISDINLLIIDSEDLLMTSSQVVRENFDRVIEILIKEINTRKEQYSNSNSDSKIFDNVKQYMCLINGFDTLMKTLSSDNASKFKDALKDIKNVYKINFIILDSASGLKEYAYDEWYKQYISGVDGLWIGDGIADQYVIKPSKITNDMYKEIGEEFGYFLVKGKAQLLKVLSFNDDEGEIIDE